MLSYKKALFWKDAPMKLYDALTYLSDAGYGDHSASIYIQDGPGVMMVIDDALDGTGNPHLFQQVEEWYENEVIYEPYVDAGERWALCIGVPNGRYIEPSWDGFFTYDDLRQIQEAANRGY